MGNLQKHGGPLSASWNEAQFQLARQINQRMTDLGIIPVLPAFTGFMPRTAPKSVEIIRSVSLVLFFSRRFPTAKFYNSSDWVGFGCNESWYVFFSI